MNFYDLRLLYDEIYFYSESYPLTDPNSSFLVTLILNVSIFNYYYYINEFEEKEITLLINKIWEIENETIEVFSTPINRTEGIASIKIKSITEYIYNENITYIINFTDQEFLFMLASEGIRTEAYEDTEVDLNPYPDSYEEDEE